VIQAENSEPSDLVGFLNLIHPSRLQVLGAAEVAYFSKLEERKQQSVLNELFAGAPPAVIIAEGLEGPSSLLLQAPKNHLPILRSRAAAATVIDTLLQALGQSRGATVSMHGVLMDVLGMGVLISGESGLGKSELALELISRGHGLVADDVVEFNRTGPAAIDGRCPALLQNLLEVRGLGLLDIKTIFGETAVRRKMRLKLIVHLVRRSTMESEYERLPLEALNQNVLGLPIRKVVVPVAAGRNLAVLTEAAVRSTILQLRGIDTVAEFISRQQRQIDESV
jgi:HPr kinase/phosphorylase